MHSFYLCTAPKYATIICNNNKVISSQCSFVKYEVPFSQDANQKFYRLWCCRWRATDADTLSALDGSTVCVEILRAQFEN